MTADEAPGLPPETAEVRDLLAQFGERWAIWRSYRAGKPVWLACRRPERGSSNRGDNEDFPVLKATVPELRAVLEILDGRP